jgi:8-oxo-dGTP pyrophosphatase MutT (NUDIX family)
VQDKWGWELPGGLIDEGEEPSATAVRELEEETGYRAGRVEHLVTFQPMVGMVDSEHFVFAAARGCGTLWRGWGTTASERP